MVAYFSRTKQKLRSGEINEFDLPSSYSAAKSKEIHNIDEWVKQILYWRSHLDVFIEDYFSTDNYQIKFTDFQKCIVRAIGNSSISQDSETRGGGKTWKMATILSALAILYPDSPILVVSKNVGQALLTLNYIEKLADSTPNLKREIIYPIKIQQDYGLLKFKNGSVIKVKAMGNNGDGLRGERAKVIFIDEGVLITTQIFEKVLRPILNYKRPVWWNLRDTMPEFEDYPSKLIEASSAFLRSCDYYNRGVDIAKTIMNGSDNNFLCCISYKTCERLGMIDPEKIEMDKATMSKDVFDMEYGCLFLGAVKGAFYPYDLVEPCRVMETVELKQPTGSKSRYVMGLDIANSDKKQADKTAIAIIKFNEKSPGSFSKQLVFMRTYKGYNLRMIAEEVRKYCVRFPNLEKIVIDINGVGRGISSILGDTYVDPETNKEYPPLIPDTTLNSSIGTGLAVIREYIGNNNMNNTGAIALKMFLENRSLKLPVSSVNLKGIEKQKKKNSKVDNAFLLEEAAVFSEVDALVIELGNIKQIPTSSGYKFDTESNLQHKDRYSAVMMCCFYIDEIEKEAKRNRRVNGDEGSFLGYCVAW